MADSEDERPIDIMLWGATGFTGQMATAYMAGHAAAFVSMTPGDIPKGLRFGLAGRNREKLENVKREMGCAEDVPIYVADAADAAAVDEVVKQARVLCSLAGPFVLYGSNVVSACARFGTHYVDITGEVAWVRDMVEKYEEIAKVTKACIVPMCGFDSIPSDLGTLFAVQELRHAAAAGSGGGDDVVLPADTPVRKVSCLQKMSGGGMSGGSLASGIAMEQQPVVLASGMDVDDPFLLGGEPDDGARDEDEFPTEPAYFGDPLETWGGPFMMAQINSRVVRRSNSLLRYGKQFGYVEYATAPSEEAAQKMAQMSIAGPPPEKRQAMIEQGRLPAPGEGPSREQREGASFCTILQAVADDGKSVVVTVSGGEAGYEETAKMVCEAALTLACDYETCPGHQRFGGGFLTPASAMGNSLIKRLVNAGISFDVRKNDSAPGAVDLLAPTTTESDEPQTPAAKL